MPFQMWEYVQSVMVQGTVYVGGGVAGVGSPDYIVMAYDTNSRKWATLPPYKARGFAMTALNNTPDSGLCCLSFSLSLSQCPWQTTQHDM